MKTLLLIAAAAAALATTLMVAQAQERDRAGQVPAAGVTQSQSGAVQPRAVKTQSFRSPAQSNQASTDGRNDTAAADTQNTQQPPPKRRASRLQHHRVSERHSPRPLRARVSRTRGSAAARAGASTEALPLRSRAQHAQAAYVERGAVGPADRISLTEPQVAQLNSAFAGYITRMNVWSMPPSAFPATVGATVPAWVHVYGIPVEIVAIYPEFSGDEFVVVGDDIVVLEPGSRRIVAMISRTSNAAVAALNGPPETTGSAPPAEERVRLTGAQMATIRTVLRDPACRYERPSAFFIGSLMPAAAPACAFPQRVVTAVPAIGGYRYITRRNAVVVIDPGTDRVVTMIR